jgi:hypothetical protein
VRSCRSLWLYYVYSVTAVSKLQYCLWLQTYETSYINKYMEIIEGCLRILTHDFIYINKYMEIIEGCLRILTHDFVYINKYMEIIEGCLRILTHDFMYAFSVIAATLSVSHKCHFTLYG